MVPILLVALVLMISLGLLWVKGFEAVKRHAPERIPQFYYVTAILRITVVLALVLVFRLLYGPAEIKTFAAVVLAMYALMMTVSLVIKH